MKHIVFVLIALGVAQYTLHQDSKIEYTKYHLSTGN